MRENDLIDVKKLQDSDSFCILPWTHLYISPLGIAQPCCVSKDMYGKINETQSIEDIWNSSEIKKMRLDMVTEVKRPGCISCYMDEKNGKESARKSVNKYFSDHFKYIKETKEDGTFEKFNLVYWDFRLSNTCNFKCITCGPELSSTWYKELTNESKVNKIDILSQLENLYPIVESIYFAGGEPLLMEDHYKILDKLIENKKFDVLIFYSTNFSCLGYKNKNVLEYWKHFNDLEIVVSIDGFGERGELIRKGLDWKKLVKNINEFKNKLPNKKIKVVCTVQALNCLHVIDLHRQLYEENLINHVDDFVLNFLINPSHLSVNIFPSKFKKELIKKINDHIDNFLIPTQSIKALEDFKSYINYVDLNKKDSGNNFIQFIEYIKVLSSKRNDNFRKVFPEFEDLIWSKLNI